MSIIWYKSAKVYSWTDITNYWRMIFLSVFSFILSTILMQTIWNDFWRSQICNSGNWNNFSYSRNIFFFHLCSLGTHSHYRQGSLIISYTVTYLGRDPINTKDLDDAINQAFTSGNFPNAVIDQSFTSHQGKPSFVTPCSHHLSD